VLCRPDDLHHLVFDELPRGGVLEQQVSLGKGTVAGVYLQTVVPDIFIITAQQEVYLLSALYEPGTVLATDGSCSND